MSTLSHRMFSTWRTESEYLMIHPWWLAWDITWGMIGFMAYGDLKLG